MDVESGRDSSCDGVHPIASPLSRPRKESMTLTKKELSVLRARAGEVGGKARMAGMSKEKRKKMASSGGKALWAKIRAGKKLK